MATTERERMSRMHGQAPADTCVKLTSPITAWSAVALTGIEEKSKKIPLMYWMGELGRVLGGPLLTLVAEVSPFGKAKNGVVEVANKEDRGEGEEDGPTRVSPHDQQEHDKQAEESHDQPGQEG